MNVSKQHCSQDVTEERDSTADDQRAFFRKSSSRFGEGSFRQRLERIGLAYFVTRSMFAVSCVLSLSLLLCPSHCRAQSFPILQRVFSSDFQADQEGPQKEDQDLLKKNSQKSIRQLEEEMDKWFVEGPMQEEEDFYADVHRCWNYTSSKINLGSSLAKKLLTTLAQKSMDIEVRFYRLAHSCRYLQGPETVELRPLNKNVFSCRETSGVKLDLKRAWAEASSRRLHLFQVASQYNGSESPSKIPLPVGEAMLSTVGSPTQGVAVQRCCPRMFELTNLCLAHAGFNALERVIEGSSTLASDLQDPRVFPIQGGYLEVNDRNSQRIVAKAFKERWDKLETPMFSFPPPEDPFVFRNTYVMLQSAPCCKKSLASNDLNVLQQYASFANYVAIFLQAIDLWEEHFEFDDVLGEMVIHLTIVGGGVYRNKAENIQWGLHRAALLYEQELADRGIQVEILAFKGPQKPGDPPATVGIGMAQQIAKELGLDIK